MTKAGIDQTITNSRKESASERWIDREVGPNTLAGKPLELCLQLHLLFLRKWCRTGNACVYDITLLVEHIQEFLRRCDEVFRTPFAYEQADEFHRKIAHPLTKDLR